MSLLQNNKRYTRPQPQEAQMRNPTTLLDVLEAEESRLLYRLEEIAHAKSLEGELTLYLNVVQQSLSALRALEAAPEPVQETQPPAPAIKNVRKAATKKAVTPTERPIAIDAVVDDTEKVIAHDDFSTFPE